MCLHSLMFLFYFLFSFFIPCLSPSSVLLFLRFPFILLSFLSSFLLFFCLMFMFLLFLPFQGVRRKISWGAGTISRVWKLSYNTCRCKINANQAFEVSKKLSHASHWPSQSVLLFRALWHPWNNSSDTSCWKNENIVSWFSYEPSFWKWDPISPLLGLRDHQCRLRDHQCGCKGGNRFEKGGLQNLTKKAMN